MSDGVLRDQRVLILEDETLVSFLLEDMVENLGCQLAGAYSRLDRALEAVNGGVAVDLAVLDVNVAGQQSFPLAEILAARGVPLVFATGYDESGLPERWRGLPTLRKPFLQEQVRVALLAALAAQA